MAVLMQNSKYEFKKKYIKKRFFFWIVGEPNDSGLTNVKKNLRKCMMPTIVLKLPT